MTTHKLKIAIIGATGAVGRRMILALEHFKIDAELRLFASPKSAGLELPYQSKLIAVEAFHRAADVSGSDVVLMSAGGQFSREHAAAIAEQGCVVIDNSSAWRMEQHVPLVVPEVNASLIKGFKGGIIANPNCSTIQLVVALQPLHQAFGLDLVNVATYQSVSGSGQKGIEELQKQNWAGAHGSPLIAEKYAMPIFNNLIPAIDVIGVEGHCFEEKKMIDETRKIMGLPGLKVLATTVRVPVLNCHSETVTVHLQRPVSRSEVMQAFSDASGMRVSAKDDYQHFAYPQQVHGSHEVWVSRVRLPLGQERSNIVQFWNVADNLNKGAATNAVQILMGLNQ